MRQHYEKPSYAKADRNTHYTAHCISLRNLIGILVGICIFSRRTTFGGLVIEIVLFPHKLTYREQYRS